MNRTQKSRLIRLVILLAPLWLILWTAYGYFGGVEGISGPGWDGALWGLLVIGIATPLLAVLGSWAVVSAVFWVLEGDDD